MSDVVMEVIVYDGEEPCELVKWKVGQDARLSKGTILFVYSRDGKELKYKSNYLGTIKTLLAKEGSIIMKGTQLAMYEKCLHPTIMKDLCAECGQDLRQLDRDDPIHSSASVSMVHSVPELRVSVDLAEKLGKADEDRLLKDRKLVLLVDLDQTLIHSTNHPAYHALEGVEHYQLYGPNTPWYHTKFRPHTEHFLEDMFQLYELHICTFGARMYAHKIASLLDPTKKYFSHRILSRDECFDPTLKTGNLKALFPCGDSLVCIIDDREDVWSYAPNMIAVKPYSFFKNTGDINDPLRNKAEAVYNNLKVTAKHVSPDKPTVSPSAESSEKNTELPTSASEEVIRSAEKTSTTGAISESITSCRPESDEFDNREEITSEAKIDLDGNREALPAQEEPSSTDTSSSSSPASSGFIYLDSASPEISTSSDTGFKSSDTEKPSSSSEVANSPSSMGYETVVKPDSSSRKIRSVFCETLTDESSCSQDAIERLETDKDITKTEKSDEEPDCLEKYKATNVHDEDDYLLYLGDILRRIHTEYYKLYDEIRKFAAEEEHITLPDLKTLIPKVKKSVLQGCNLVFSGVIPTNLPLERSKLYCIAKSLGANITKDVILNGSPLERTTHVIASKFGTAKVNRAQKSPRIFIVNPFWLSSCAERWDKVEERLFTLKKDDDFSISQKNNNLTEEQRAFLSVGSERVSSRTLGTVETTHDSIASTSTKNPAAGSSTETSHVYDSTTGKRFSIAVAKASSSDDDILFDDREMPQNMLFLSPLSGFSEKDLQLMDKEVDDACSEGDDLNSESSGPLNADDDTRESISESSPTTTSESHGMKYDQVSRSSYKRTYDEIDDSRLGTAMDESSDEESNNYDYPSKWNTSSTSKRKRSKFKRRCRGDDEDDEDDDEEQDDETRDSFMDRSDSSSNDDDYVAESADEEIAAAVELVPGFKRGSRELGMPTANIDLTSVSLPALESGIYYGYAQLIRNSDNTKPTIIFRPHIMCACYGYNPFYGNLDKSLEIHILHKFEENFYGETLRVAICGKIRDEKNFDSLNDLIKAIDSDIAATKEMIQQKWSSFCNDDFFLKTS